MNYFCLYKSPIGEIYMRSDGNSLTGLSFSGQKYFHGDLCTDVERREIPVFDRTTEWLDIYFGGKIPGFTPELLLRGTPFRRCVWDLLLEIPYGETVTYGHIAALAAEKMGAERMSAQAVGGAVGHNPIGIIVPCHRVTGSDGSLIGYAGGLEKKSFLLDLESNNKNK